MIAPAIDLCSFIEARAPTRLRPDVRTDGGVWYNKPIDNVLARAMRLTSPGLTIEHRRFYRVDTIPQDDTPRKQCTSCPNSYPATLEFFYRDKKGKYGLTSRCKMCRRAKKAEWTNSHREYTRTYMNNRYRLPGKREHILLYQKEYSHRPHARDRDHAYNKNPRRQAQTNRKNHTRRAQKRNSSGTFTVAQTQDLLERQKYCCYYCFAQFERYNNKHIYHIDHAVPLIRGGSNDISNIVLACPTCNLRKNKRLPHEFPEGGRLL